MVGRKSLVPLEIIKAELANHITYDEGYKLKGKKQKVWEDISIALESKIQPTSIYLMVHQDRNKLKTYYEELKCI